MWIWVLGIELAAYDPSSAEPPVTHGGARKSVAPATIGREANVVAQRSPPAAVPAADQDHPAPPAQYRPAHTAEYES